MSSFIDTLLHRQLYTGKQFEGLIPPSKGTQQYFEAENEFSDTYETLEFMALWAYTYAYQMKKVAPLLKGATLSETVENIYNWLYRHFQYKIDGQLQQLYAPSAAWENRVTGFDCKTYSLLASTILQNLSIPHAFRKVKQPGMMPDEWTHVYVIVPTQNNKYLVIDATTHDNKEVSKIDKYDYTMKLKHVGLACPAAEQVSVSPSLACPGEACACGTGLAGTYGGYGFDMNSLYTIPLYPMQNGNVGLNGTFDSIKNYLKTPISCWGGSAFSASQANSNIAVVEKLFNNLIFEINRGVSENNTAKVSKAVADIYAWSDVMLRAFIQKKAEGWNECTTQNCNAMIEMMTFYKNVVTKALEAWFTKFFDKQPTGQKVRYTNESTEGMGVYFTWTDRPGIIVKEETMYTYLPKPLSTPIPVFEMTPYVYNAITNTSTFNVTTYLNGLSTILVAGQQILNPTNTGGSTTTADSGTYDGTTGTYTPPKNKPSTSNMGMNLLFGGILTWAAISVLQSSPKTKSNAK